MVPIRVRIREERVQRGWSQVELARRAGVRQATISKLERGQIRRIDFSAFEKIAKALRVPLPKILKVTAVRGADGRRRSDE